MPPPGLGPDPNEQLSFIRPPKHGSSQNNVGINMVLGLRTETPPAIPLHPHFFRKYECFEKTAAFVSQMSFPLQ